MEIITMTIQKTDIHALRHHFKELSKEEIKTNTQLEEIDGLALLTYKVHIANVEQFELIKPMLENYDISIVENTDGVYKIDQYKEAEGVTNKFFIQDGFRHIDVNGRTYYYNVLPSVAEKGNMHFKTNRTQSEWYFKTLNSLSEEEYAEKKVEIDKKLMKHTKLLSTRDPVLDGFIIELIAVVKEKQTGA